MITSECSDNEQCRCEDCTVGFLLAEILACRHDKHSAPALPKHFNFGLVRQRCPKGLYALWILVSLKDVSLKVSSPLY